MTTMPQAGIGRTIVTTPGDREIRTERIFNASRERVWRAMTEPAELAQWWGRGNRLVVEAFDLQPGGRWRFVEHSDHGVHGFEGYFREVVPLERMSKTFQWDGMKAYPCVQTIVLEDLGDGRTKVTGTSLFFATDERDGMLQSGMEAGMNAAHAALDRLLERSA